MPLLLTDAGAVEGVKFGERGFRDCGELATAEARVFLGDFPDARKSVDICASSRTTDSEGSSEKYNA